MSCEDPPHEIMECKRHKIAQDGSCHDGINTKAPCYEARLPRRFHRSADERHKHLGEYSGNFSYEGREKDRLRPRGKGPCRQEDREEILMAAVGELNSQGHFLGIRGSKRSRNASPENDHQKDKTTLPSLVVLDVKQADGPARLPDILQADPASGRQAARHL